MLGKNLEDRIHKHHKELDDFKVRKEAIQMNCEALNLKIPNNLLHLRSEDDMLSNDEFDQIQ